MVWSPIWRGSPSNERRQVSILRGTGNRVEGGLVGRNEAMKGGGKVANATQLTILRDQSETSNKECEGTQ